MKATALFLYVFLLLSGGYETAYAGTGHSGFRQTQAHLIATTQTALDNVTPGKGKEFLIFEDVKDEDENNAARKYRLLASSYLTALYTPSLSYLSNPYKPASSFCRQASCKYIMQRVLRV